MIIATLKCFSVFLLWYNAASRDTEGIAAATVRGPTPGRRVLSDRVHCVGPHFGNPFTGEQCTDMRYRVAGTRSVGEASVTIHAGRPPRQALAALSVAASAVVPSARPPRRPSPKQPAPVSSSADDATELSHSRTRGPEPHSISWSNYAVSRSA